MQSVQSIRSVLFSVGERARHGKKMNQTNDGTKTNGSEGGKRVEKRMRMENEKMGERIENDRK